MPAKAPVACAVHVRFAEYATVQARVASFHRWVSLGCPQNRNINPQTLADAGFYHLPLPEQPDRCACFCCGKAVHCWDPEDRPLVEHQRLWRHCPYAKQRSVGRGHGTLDDPRTKRQRRLPKPRASPPSPAPARARGARKRPPPSAPPPVEDETMVVSIEVPVKAEALPVFPEYSTLHARLQSFAAWQQLGCPMSRWVNPDSLARAGFFHQPEDGKLDRCACFSCGETLKWWGKEDRPMEEHQRQIPHCAFVTAVTTNPAPNRPAPPTVLVEEANPHCTTTPQQATSPTQGNVQPGFSNAGHRTLEGRLATFQAWQALGGLVNDRINPTALADAGFIHCPIEGEPDRCACPECCIALHAWQPQDFPILAHQQAAPRCPFLSGEGIARVTPNSLKSPRRQKPAKQPA
eukprot:GGOE01020798.1.p1 GENE.GGOE01020798.1~~GGOE01020798.1.p1  ORF type:complete len:406 (-),score=44.87 GGOE01020798.1:235-1452(-)